MTPNKEDYLKTIYKLGGTERLVSNKLISEELKISPSSVTEMVGKLGDDGLIEYQKYKGSRLTQKGLDATISLVKGHRLWEVFLIEHLDYSWSEAHEDAELLEHIVSPRLVARLDKFLGFPERCPHGYAIRGEPDHSSTDNLRPLGELKAGETSYLRQVKEEPELMDYLQGLGLQIGSAVTVILTGEYEGSVTIELDGRRLQISYKAAQQIYVD